MIALLAFGLLAQAHAFSLDPNLLALSTADRAHYREISLRGWSAKGALVQLDALQLTSAGRIKYTQLYFCGMRRE